MRYRIDLAGLGDDADPAGTSSTRHRRRGSPSVCSGASDDSRSARSTVGSGRSWPSATSNSGGLSLRVPFAYAGDLSTAGWRQSVT